MRLKVFLRRQAQADIETIEQGIAADNLRMAAIWAADLRDKCQSLAEFPERAPVYRGQIRRLVVGQYLVFYRIADPDIPNLRRVIIIRVLHGARNIGDLVDREK
jgi:plasmid stabilization system protein ParE